MILEFIRLFFYAVAFSTVMLSSFFLYMLYMPQQSWQQTLLPLSESEQQLVHNTQQHVQALCINPKGRSYLEKESLDAARDYIAAQFQAYGYQVQYQHYQLYGEEYSLSRIMHVIKDMASPS
ncbi:MAG: hypothetical protein Q9M28_08660 [Mariprofundaceae bacterium]|nr:hypothetical protein [Mariprofundaceae bacterium]